MVQRTRAVIQQCEIRRRLLYPLWLRGVSPREAPRRVFQDTNTGAEEGPFKEGTIYSDYQFFAKEASRHSLANLTKGRTEAKLWKVIADAGAAFEDTSTTDAGGRASLLRTQIEALKEIHRINGLAVERREIGGIRGAPSEPIVFTWKKPLSDEETRRIARAVLAGDGQNADGYPLLGDGKNNG